MKEDLRIIKTKAAIENAFIELIEELGFENVKIIDIARKAQVNRNTIYLHYKTKEEMIETLITREFQSQIDKLQIQQYLTVRNSRHKVNIMFETILKIIYEKIDFYRIIITDQNLSGYFDKLIRDIKNFVMKSIKQTKKNNQIVDFALNGVYGFIKNWIIYDVGTIEENAKILTELVLAIARKLQFI